MCGIAGFVGRGTENDVLRMQRAILHRGPDDQGHEFRPGVGLAHTRLSILDLSPLGHQPMFSYRLFSKRDIGIVFNGEIYNFKMLREELGAKGYQFKGTSDTEIILALYEEYGVGCFEKMDGMFAIALYDYDKKELVLARDRMGKKPLYWVDYGDVILFGSELKALAAHPSFKKEIDPESFAAYLAHDYVPTPRTIFKHVRKLAPGTYRVWREGKILADGRYWQMQFPSEKIPFDEAVRELDTRLAQAVETRLVADVPVGVFLSGGIDSSTVAYYAQRSAAQKIKTFSIRFDDPDYDESQYAEEVSRYLGTDHTPHLVSQEDLLSFIPHLGEVLDEPMADASIVPMYFLSGHTRKEVAVALGGDGGDELFAGYPTFLAEKYARIYLAMPSVLRNLAAASLAHIKETDGYLSLGFKIKKFLSGMRPDMIERHAAWLGSFDAVAQRKIAPEFATIDPYGTDRFWDHAYRGVESPNRLLHFYMRTYLMDQVMVKVDRATMAHALEARAPFLDTALVEYVNRLPYSYKLHGKTGKYALKKLMSQKDSSGRARLPESIVWREKQGFALPLTKWLREDLRDWVDSVLDQRSIQEAGLLNYEEVRRLKEEHFKGVRDNRKLLWNLIAFELWRRRWLS